SPSARESGVGVAGCAKLNPSAELANSPGACQDTYRIPLLEIASDGSEPLLLPGRFTATWKPGVAGVAVTCAAGKRNSGKMDRAKRASRRRFSTLGPPPVSDDDQRPSCASTVVVCPQPGPGKRRRRLCPRVACDL